LPMDIHGVKSRAEHEIEAARDPETLEKIRIKYLGRKGEVTAVLRSLSGLSLGSRREIGPRAQELKRELEAALKEKLNGFAASYLRPKIDLTAPGKKISRGHLHPLTLVDREIRKIFLGFNFSVVEGPEVETEYYNFDALNIPPDHPARDEWDTFWLLENTSSGKTQGTKRKNDTRLAPSDKLLLRTHTSPVQARYMESHNPPFQIIVPGRVFRYEATDQNHEINFYQLEGLMVGKNITLANFKFIVEEFFKKFFGPQFTSRRIEFRYRPSYFPFVEPGVEVDIKLKNRWLEVMGAGMVHPRVFEYAHYNPRDFQGFAFGVGVDRLAMIKYGIPDIRLFYSGDLRFIRQFS